MLLFNTQRRAQINLLKYEGNLFAQQKEDERNGKQREMGREKRRGEKSQKGNEKLCDPDTLLKACEQLERFLNSRSI